VRWCQLKNSGLGKIKKKKKGERKAMGRTETNFDELLDKVLETSEFEGWTEDSFGSGIWRDYRGRENPSETLSRFGLYDFKEGKLKESLIKVAIRVGVLKGKKEEGGKNSGENKSEEEKGDLAGWSGFGAKSHLWQTVNDENQNAQESGQELKFKRAIAGEGEMRRASRGREEAKIKEMFGTRAGVEAWKRESLEILWGYFVEGRKVAGEDGVTKQEFAQLMYEINAHVVRWTRAADGDDDGVGEKVIEIKIPMWAVPKAERLKDRKLVSVMGIEVAEVRGEGGVGSGLAYKKLKKKIHHKQIDRRSISFGDKRDGIGVVCEGIEDALTLYFRDEERIGRAEEGGECGALGEKRFGRGCYYAVSAGKGGLRDAWQEAARLDKEDGDPTALVVQVCDRDVEGDAGDLDAEGTLGYLSKLGLCLQLIQDRAVKFDCNAAVVKGGSSGLEEWIRGLREVKVRVGGEREIEGGMDSNTGEVRENGDMNVYSEGEIRKEYTIPELLARIERLSRNIWDESGAAQLWSVLFKDQFLMSEDKSVWRYDESKGVWSRDSDDSAIFRCMEGLRQIYDQLIPAMAEADKDYDSGSRADQTEKFLKRFSQKATEENVVRMVMRHEIKRCQMSDFDPNPYEICCRNGVVDLKEGKLKSWSREGMHSRQAAAKWIEGKDGRVGRAEVFETFLAEIMQNDEELIAYKWLQYAYICSGLVKEKCMFLHYGETGNNGKSTEANILMKVLGDYATVINPELLMEGNSNNEKSYMLAQLPGVRLAVCGELSERRRWDETVLKSITGSDEVACRHMFRQQFSYTPVSKIMMHCNNLPKISAGDRAFWNRIHLVPYEYTCENPDKQLEDKVLGGIERDIIFTKMCKAFQRYQEEGELTPVSLMQEGVESYQSEGQGDMEMFMEEEIEIDGAGEVGATELHLAYLNFSKRKGFKYPSSAKMLGRFFSQLGVGAKKLPGGKRVRTGIRLKNKTTPWGDDDLGFN
jgi:P4 family phage/plasmid primase-like protien